MKQSAARSIVFSNSLDHSFARIQASFFRLISWIPPCFLVLLVSFGPLQWVSKFYQSSHYTLCQYCWYCSLWGLWWVLYGIWLVTSYWAALRPTNSSYCRPPCLSFRWYLRSDRWDHPCSRIFLTMERCRPVAVTSSALSIFINI
jgi:hypothetical protein